MRGNPNGLTPAEIARLRDADRRSPGGTQDDAVGALSEDSRPLNADGYWEGLPSSSPSAPSRRLDPSAAATGSELAWNDRLVERLRAALPDAIDPLSAREAENERLGTMIGKHRLLRVVGRGGMGIVYEAENSSLNAREALKMIRHAHHAQFGVADRLQREAQRQAQLAHPNIVRVFDADIHDGHPYFTMELVRGSTLEQVFPPGKADFADIARVLGNVALAIAYAHSQGILHLDLKPANILMDGDVPKVLDFGLGQVAFDDSAESMVGAGTPGFAAPEQGERSFFTVSPATDVYGLGAVLFRLITGRTLSALEIPQANRIGQRVPTDLSGICHACLEPDPRSRPDVAYVAQALANFATGRPPPGSGALRKIRCLARRRRWLFASACVAGLSVIAMGASIVSRERLRLRERAESAIDEGLRRAMEGHVGEGIATMTVNADRLSGDSRAAQRTAVDWWASRRPNVKAVADFGALVRDAAMSDDGTVVWCATTDGMARWKPSDGPIVDVPTAPGLHPVMAVAVSSSGRFAAAIGQEKRFDLFDLSVSDVGKPFAVHERATALCFLRQNGSFLASHAGVNPELIEWKSDGSRRRNFRWPQPSKVPAMKSLVASFDGKHVVGVGLDGSAWLWNTESGDCLGEVGKRIGGAVRFAGFSADGRALAMAGDGIGVLSLGKGQETQAVRIVKLTATEKTTDVVARDDGGAAAIISGPTGPILRRFCAGLSAWCDTPLAEQCGHFRLICGRDGDGVLCGLGTARLELLELPPFPWRSAEIALLEIDARLATSPKTSETAALLRPVWQPNGKPQGDDSDSTVRFWRGPDDLTAGQRIPTPRDRPVRCLAMVPDGSMLAAGLEMRRKSPGSLLLSTLRHEPFCFEELKRSTGHVRELAFANDGRTLLAGVLNPDLTGHLEQWNLATRTLEGSRPLPAAPTGLAVGSSRIVAVACSNGQVCVWDNSALRGSPRVATVGQNAFDLKIDPNGRHVAVGSKSGTITVLRVSDSTLDVLARIPGAREEEQRFAFSPSGRMLVVASSGSRSAIRVFECATWRQIGVDLVVEAGVAALDFSGKGLNLVSQDGRFHVGNNVHVGAW